jgi:hypothetical protein
MQGPYGRTKAAKRIRHLAGALRARSRTCRFEDPEQALHGRAQAAEFLDAIVEARIERATSCFPLIETALVGLLLSPGLADRPDLLTRQEVAHEAHGTEPCFARTAGEQPLRPDRRQRGREAFAPGDGEGSA